MFNSYEETEGEKITRSQAISEVKAHNVPVEEFLLEMGDHKEYDAQAVLNWLGY